MNEFKTDSPLTHALIEGGPEALIAELKAQGEWEDGAPTGYTHVTYGFASGGTSEDQARASRHLAESMMQTLPPRSQMSQLADAFTNGGPNAFYAEKYRQRLVAQARLDAQRIKQRQWNATNVEPPRQPLSARKIVTALAGVYGYAPTFNGLRLPGLKLRA